LIVALKDGETFVRRSSVVALGQIKDVHAVEPLIAALIDENASVRKSAALALGEIKDTRAVEPLIAALKDEDADARGSAAIALGEINDARAVEPLIAVFKDKDLFVRRSSAVALGEIKDVRAVNALLTILKDKRVDIIAVSYVFFIRRGEPGTEDILIEALNKFGDPGMAEDFLNCGNCKLKEAASLWAKKNGYTLRHLPNGKGKPVWGQEK
jgi:HEAT repeat protein